MSVLAVDVGAMVTALGWTIGTALRNVVPEESLPLEWRVALRYRVEAVRLSLLGEYVEEIGLDEAVSAGVEWGVAENFGLRGGVSRLGHGGNLEIAAGGSARLGRLRLDYSFNTHLIGITNRVSLSYLFGSP